MTVQQEKNIDFVQKSIGYAGFTKDNNETVRDQMLAGIVSDVAMEPSHKEYGKDRAVIFEPAVQQMEDRPGFYNFLGFKATLYERDKDPVDHFFSHFKMTGPTLDQAHDLLSGKTMVVSNYDNSKPKDDPDRKRLVYMRIDLASGQKSNDGRFPEIIADVKNVDVLALASQVYLLGNAEQKNANIKDLQLIGKTTARVGQNLQDRVGIRTNLELELASSSVMKMNIVDQRGQQIDQKEIAIKQPSQTLTQGLKAGVNNNLPDFVKAAMSRAGKIAQSGSPQMEAGSETSKPDGGKPPRKNQGQRA